jgi:hypothetical protein
MTPTEWILTWQILAEAGSIPLTLWFMIWRKNSYLNRAGRRADEKYWQILETRSAERYPR